MNLQVELKHRFRRFQLDTSFTLDRPGITALFGPSGSGKTSTVNAIAGLLRPESGRVCLDGQTLLDTRAGIAVPSHKRRIGYVFQDARLFPHLSVKANLEFGARRTRPRQSRSEIDAMVALLDIEHLLERRPAGLSGGERQRVALGRTLLSRPRLLLLDEPLSALDHARRDEIMPYIESLRDDAALPIVYVSHSLDEVTRLADRMIIMDQGRVAARGSVFDIMSRLDLFPLTGRFEAGAVINARIASHDDADHLSELQFDGGRLWIARLPGRMGDSVRVRIRARDVALALNEPVEISTNNVLPAVIKEMRRDEGAYTELRLLCGSTPLLARITHRASTRLGLRPGLNLYALVKSVSVQYLSARLRPR